MAPYRSSAALSRPAQRSLRNTATVASFRPAASAAPAESRKAGGLAWYCAVRRRASACRAAVSATAGAARSGPAADTPLRAMALTPRLLSASPAIRSTTRTARPDGRRAGQAIRNPADIVPALPDIVLVIL